MDEVKKEIDVFFDKIETSKNYQDLLLINKQLKNDDEIKGLISDIKRLQKIATNNHDIVVEQKLKDLYRKLNSYPIYQSYLIKKDELYKELSFTKETFEKYFKDILKIEI